MSTVTLAARPFGSEQHIDMPLGLSIDDIVRRITGGVSGVVAFLRCPEGALQQWEWAPPSRWKWIKPKGESCLRIEHYPAGGGGRGNVFATIVSVAALIAAPYLAGGIVSTLAPVAFGFQTVGAQLATSALTAGIAIGGNLAAAKLYGGASSGRATSLTRTVDDAQAAFSNIDTDINPLAKDIPPPKILGHRRVTLPSACAPHKFLENGVEVIEACLVATGYHSITDIRIGKVSADSLEGVTYQIRDGQEATKQQTLIKRVTKTISVGAEFAKFTTKANSLELADQNSPDISEPYEVVFAPGYNEKMEQITARLSLEPFLYQSSDTAEIRLPLRIRMWRKDTPETVINLPEIHIHGRKTTRLPKEIRIRWDNAFGFVGASNDFDYSFYQKVPATASELSDGSTGVQWQAHASMVDGAGLQDTIGISKSLDSINIELDETQIPKGDYEIGVTVGLPVQESQFDDATYKLNGSVESLFRAKKDSNRWKLPAPVDGVFAGAALDFAVLVVKRLPVEAPGYAQVPIKFRGVSAKNVTVMAGAYTYDWGGSAWDDLSITQNPAPHFRDALRYSQDFAGVDKSLNADDEFLAWRQECEAKGYPCNLICNGQSVNEVLGDLATAGLATKRFGSGYGIDYHRDRSSETPECTFTHRDSKISFTRAFPFSPKGAAVDFEDEDNEYIKSPITVNNQWRKTNLPGNRTMVLKSVTNRTHAERIAVLDLIQEAEQGVIWNIDTGPAGFNRKKGSMIGLITDLDTDHAYGFFIRQVTGPRSVAVDREVAATSQDPLDEIDDLTVIDDLLISGETAVAHILTPAGLENYTIASVAGNVITFTEDLPASWTVTKTVEGSDQSVTYTTNALAGTRMSVAARDELFRKLIVLDVKRQAEGRASIEAVQYSQKIVAYLEKHYQ